MKAHTLRCGRSWAVLACLALLAALPTLPARGQAGGGYELGWSSVDGGGATGSSGGGHWLGGTAGQPDAGLLAGGEYTLAGGFWAGGLFGSRAYLPLLLRRAP